MSGGKKNGTKRLRYAKKPLFLSFFFLYLTLWTKIVNLALGLVTIRASRIFREGSGRIFSLPRKILYFRKSEKLLKRSFGKRTGWRFMKRLALTGREWRGGEVGIGKKMVKRVDGWTSCAPLGHIQTQRGIVNFHKPVMRVSFIGWTPCQEAWSRNWIIYRDEWPFWACVPFSNKRVWTRVW